MKNKHNLYVPNPQRVLPPDVTAAALQALSDSDRANVETARRRLERTIGNVGATLAREILAAVGRIMEEIDDETR